MKVYIASQYPRRSEMREVARLLRSHNIEVTSRWLQEKADLTSQLHDATDDENLRAALTDREDIDRADAVMLFAEDPLIGLPRGTHHHEFGYGMGKGKRLILIDGPENIFHYLPEVVHYKTVFDFLDAEGIQDVIAAD